jgi:hypothetical protein
MGYSVSFFLLILVPASSWGQTGPPFHHYATAPVGMTILWDYRQPSSRRFRDISLPHNCHPDQSGPGFPATLHWTQPRVRLSLGKAHEV